MPATYTLIASNTLSTSAASVTFSSILTTYTDLILRMSVRGGNAGSLNAVSRITLNGSSVADYSDTVLNAYNTTVSSFRNSSNTYFDPNSNAVPSAGDTSNTFASTEVYLPNYTSSQNKTFGNFGVSGTNTAFSITGQAALWRVTSAINSITVTNTGNNFVAGSSFFLYGIKNS
jgi:hypothetical protein